MDYLKVILIISILWINGCTPVVAKKTSTPKTMMDIYAEGSGQAKKDVASFIEKNLKEQKTFGYVKPYIPVVNEPVVRKVWIPDHKSPDNPDVMIAGHWNYLMIQPSTWFIEDKVQTSHMPIIVPAPAQKIDSPKPNEENKKYGSNNPAIRENI